ncbi:hypothetical protein [Polaromonas sp.]|uniref:type IV pilus assembly protein FimV n=1 Tax=Polaromonas sp. TaxID=1869339 RepID=UPI003263D272
MSRLFLALLLASASSAGMALSLGRSEGLALLGRPLDVAIRVVLDDAELLPATCVRADVFYSDSRVENSRVRVSLEKVGPDGDSLIRIRSSAVVDEPVVTLHVRAGCATSTERRYVLLADPAPQQMTTPALPARLAASPPASEALPSIAEKKVRPAMPQRLAQPVRRTDAAMPAAAKALPRAPAKPLARLTLEPLDLTLELPPQLRISRELPSPPPASTSQRALAAAMWKALTAEPEDVLRDAEKMSSMEADLRRLSVDTKANRETLVQLKGQLRQQRDAMGWTYAVALALALAVAAAFYLAKRRPAGHASEGPAKPWWRRKNPAEMDWLASGMGGPVRPGEDSLRADSDLLYGTSQDSQMYSGGRVSVGPTPRKPSRTLTPPLSRRDRGDFALSMPHTPRSVKAEELFDVQHQAEFFMSVGRHDQAVEVLRNHIGEDVQTSALVYLDLFGLYHQLKRRADFDELRGEFNRLFNADIPPFEAYTGASLGLESYEAVLSRIVSLWPTPGALQVIEELVFRKLGAQAEPFGLEAYRELLFLYGIAKEIVQTQPAPSESLLDFDLPSSSMVAPADSRGSSGTGRAAGRMILPRVSSASGQRLPVLDIDLSTLGAGLIEAHVTLPAEPVSLLLPQQEKVVADAAVAQEGNLIDFDLSGSSLQPVPGALRLTPSRRKR